jgi:autotransporter-associated beta strand protein
VLGAGRLIVNSPANSTYSGTVTGSGSLTKSGPGALTLTGANFFTGGATIDGGALVVSNTGGSATGTGAIAVAPGGTLAGAGRLGGNVTNQGVVNPGNDADGLVMAQTYTQQSPGKLKIDLASSSVFGRLGVAGQATLAGTLEFALAEGFVPAGASFDILDWGSLVEDFDAIVHPDLPGFNWDFSQLYATGVVSLVAAPAFESDFDGDGDVDGDDLSRWQDGFGIGTTRDQGDADGDLDVDGGDFLVWQRQTGAGVSGLSAVALVPEPSCLALLLAFAGCGGVCRRGLSW